jgi:hypothetical protein
LKPLDIRTLLFFAALPMTMVAQHTATPAPTGGVSGHVYFAVTNAPARLATVALQPVAVKPEDRPYAETRLDPPVHLYQTLLDGSFQIPNVPPGTYYVIVKYPGYLSPFSQFSNADLVHPAPDVQQRIAALLPTVNVAPNNVANIDVRLTQGAAVSGKVLFDDGAPYAGASLNLKQRGPDGKLQSVRLITPQETDDQGYFRFAGLLGGEYVLTVDLLITDSWVNSVLGQTTSSSSNYGYGLTFYSGDTPRQKDAKSFKLDDSQELSGQTLTVPISKLHAVSGAIVEQSSGKVVNKGTVTISYADDNSELTSAEVTPDDPAFHFSFLPEGEYTIKVKSASESHRETIANGPGTMPPFRIKDTVVRTFTPLDPMPLIVHSDMVGVTLPVAPVAATKPTQ